MSTSFEPIKELSDVDFTEEQIHLIPKLLDKPQMT